jgi:hypothetical protein
VPDEAGRGDTNSAGTVNLRWLDPTRAGLHRPVTLLRRHPRSSRAVHQRDDDDGDNQFQHGPMPSVRFTNLTDRPVNISLKQLTALHFEVQGSPSDAPLSSHDDQADMSRPRTQNEVAPGQTIKFKVRAARVL